MKLFSLGKKRKFLYDKDRQAISYLLLKHSRNGKLDRGVVNKFSSMYSVSKCVIRHIWQKTKSGEDICHKRAKQCGRKRANFDPDVFLQIPLSKRTTFRGLSSALNINKTSLFRLQKEGVISQETSSSSRSTSRGCCSGIYSNSALYSFLNC